MLLGGENFNLTTKKRNTERNNLLYHLLHCNNNL